MGEVGDCAKLCATCVWKVAQFIIFCWAIKCVLGLRDQWLETVPIEATVLTVQMEGFWGPVHVLVPTNCTRFKANDALVEKLQAAGESKESSKDSRRLRSSIDTAGGAEVQKPFAVQSERALRLPTESIKSAMSDRLLKEEVHGHERWEKEAEAAVETEPEEEKEAVAELEERVEEFEGVQYRDGKIIVKRCGKELHFKQPDGHQSYMAMTWMGGHDDMDELRNTRCRMLVLLAISALFENFLNMLLGVLQTCGEKMPMYKSPFGAEYEKLTQQGFTGQDKQSLPLPAKICCGICKMPFDALGKFAVTQSQMAILSLFFLYWHEDYYVTSYIPGKAFILIFALLVVMPCAMCASAVPNGAVKNGCVGCLMCFVLFVLVFVEIPFLFGYNWYNINFLWNTAMADEGNKLTFGLAHFHSGADYLQDEKIIHTEFEEVDKMEAGRKVFDWMFGAHSSEVIMNFVMDLVSGFI